MKYINIKLDSGERMIHSEQGESQIYFSAFHNNPNSCEQLAKAQVFLTLAKVARVESSDHIGRVYHKT